MKRSLPWVVALLLILVACQTPPLAVANADRGRLSSPQTAGLGWNLP